VWGDSLTHIFVASGGRFFIGCRLLKRCTSHASGLLMRRIRMISRKTFGLAVMTAALGCMLVAIAAMAVAREDDYSNPSSEQQDTQTIDRPTTTNTNRQTTTQNRQTTQPTETKAIELQGKGRQASKKFNLQPGLCILEADNDGDTNFIVRLLDVNGKEVDTLVNQIGPFAGQIGFAVDRAGDCLLDVESNGQWTAKLTQPKPEVGQSIPTTLEGNGHKTTPFIKLDKGLVIFKLNHGGDGRFKVRLMDRDGRMVAPLLNTLGNFDGSKPVSIEKPGLYFLNISADGDWTVEAE
jgi:hypothetical protein